MRLWRKLRTFITIPGADRLLVCEASVTLALARLIVLTVPLRYMAPWLSRAPDKDNRSAVLILRVRKAVAMAARNVPWNAVCLPQAMAAKAMLARRGCGSTLHLGATIVDTNGKVIAHAWLVSGDEVVVGAAGIPGMSPLARFG
jgi:Transglutaminase-like superfamily